MAAAQKPDQQAAALVDAKYPDCFGQWQAPRPVKLAARALHRSTGCVR